MKASTGRAMVTCCYRPKCSSPVMSGACLLITQVNDINLLKVLKSRPSQLRPVCVSLHHGGAERKSIQVCDLAAFLFV